MHSYGVSKNFSIRFPEPQLKHLRALSRRTGLSESDLIRQCVHLSLPIIKDRLTAPLPTDPGTGSLQVSS